MSTPETETELEPYREAYKLVVSPVMEPAAKKVAECYHALEHAKEASTSHAESANTESLEKALHFAKESLFSAAKVANLDSFPPRTSSRVDRNKDGEYRDYTDCAPAYGDKHLSRLEAERALKPLLNEYVAGIAKENNLAVPKGNSYFAVNQLSY